MTPLDKGLEEVKQRLEYTRTIYPDVYIKDFLDLERAVKVIEDYDVRLKRTVNTAYHALLEMSAWLGIPEEKRHKHIEELMSNVKYCAENDLRHMDKPT